MAKTNCYNDEKMLPIQDMWSGMVNILLELNVVNVCTKTTEITSLPLRLTQCA